VGPSTQPGEGKPLTQAGSAPTKAEENKPQAAEAKRRAEEDAREKRETDATRQLERARKLMDDAEKTRLNGDRDEATKMRLHAADRLRDVMEKFPGTKAAKEAEDLLRKVD
jgi:hypothetical protein